MIKRPHSRNLAIALFAVIATTGVASTQATANETARAATAHQPPVNDGLPMPDFDIEMGKTAIVITDPQNDFLSPKGVTWGVVGKNITDNGTVENLEKLFKVADETQMPVFI